MTALTGWGRTAPSSAEVVVALVARHRRAGGRRQGPPAARRHRQGAGPLVRRSGPERRRHRAAAARPRPRGGHRSRHRRRRPCPPVSASTSCCGCSCPAASSCPCRRAPASSPSAGPSPATSTARTTTSTARSAPTCRRLSLLLADGSVVEASPDRARRAVLGDGRRDGAHRRHPRRHDPAAADRDEPLLGRHRAGRPTSTRLLTLMDEGDRYYRYSVAWIDPMAKGRHLGRSVLTRGDHATVDQLPPRLAVDPLAYAPGAAAGGAADDPRAGPRSTTSRSRRSTRCGTARRRARRVGQILSIPGYFHPLDFVGSWNRLYGRRGFVQYQFVLPFGQETRAAPGDRAPGGVGRAELPRRAQAVRSGQPGAAELPRAGLGAGPRRAGRARGPVGPAARPRRPRARTPAGATTWPRTPTPRPRRSAAGTPDSTSGGPCGPPPTPAACGSATSAAGCACSTTDRPGGATEHGERARRSPDHRRARRHERHRTGDRRPPRVAGDAHDRARRPATSTRCASASSSGRASPSPRLHFDAADPARSRGLRAATSSPPTATSTSWSLAFGAARRPGRAGRRPGAGGGDGHRQLHRRGQQLRWPSPPSSAARATAASSCCRASPASGCARPTSSTARRRPASTASPRASATPSPAPAPACWSCARASCTRRMTAGLKAAPFATTPVGRGRGDRQGPPPRPPHGVGAGRPCAPCSASSATSPAPSGAASRLG